MKLIRSLVPVCLLTATLQAQSLRSSLNPDTTPVRRTRATANRSQYAKVELSEVAAPGDPQQGRLVSVLAEVLSYDARLNQLELFDARSRKVVRVSLAQVGRLQRLALAAQPATDVTVYGKVGTQNGQPLIVAHRLELVLLETNK